MLPAKMSTAEPTASFRPVPAQSHWQVEVTWSDGRLQLLSGYVTEDEAKSWIAFCGDQWTKIALADTQKDGKSTSRPEFLGPTTIADASLSL
jgi:hypothetical protein